MRHHQKNESLYPQHHPIEAFHQSGMDKGNCLSPICQNTHRQMPPQGMSSLHVHLGNSNNQICCINLDILHSFFLWCKEERPGFVDLFLEYTQSPQLQKAVVEKMLARYPRAAKEMDESAIGYWPLLVAVSLDPRKNLRMRFLGPAGIMRTARSFPSYSLDMFMDFISECHDEEF